MHPALASSPGTPAPRRGAHAKPVTHPVPVTSTVGDVNVACSQGSPAPRLSQDRNHGLPGSRASVPRGMAQRGRASLRTPAVAGGQRTETTREEAPWLRSPNPQTGFLHFWGTPRQRPPAPVPRGLVPSPLTEAVSRPTEAMFLAVELMLMLTLQPDQDLGETETEVERESQDTT